MNRMHAMDATYGIGTMVYHNEIHPQEVRDYRAGNYTTFVKGQPMQASARVELLMRVRKEQFDEFGAPAKHVPPAKKPSKKDRY